MRGSPRPVRLLYAAAAAALAACGGGEGTQVLPPFTLDAAGGSLDFLSGTVAVNVPAGALTEPTLFTITTSAATAPTLVPGTAFNIVTDPVVATFTPSITITIKFNPAALPTGILAPELGGYQFNSGNNTWSPLASTVNGTGDQLTISLSSTGTFAILGAPASVVTVTPGSTSIQVTHTATFSASVKDVNANVLSARTVTWSSSNTNVATVTQAGVVTGVAAGTATITAAVNGEPVSGTATVTVTAAPPPPPPGADNEPAGWTLVTDRDWGALATCGQAATRINLWDDTEACTPGNLSIISDATAPKSAPSVLEWRYPAGFVAGSAPGTAQRPTSATGFHHLYVSVWVQLSPNFQGHSSNTNKMFFIWLNGEATFFLSAEGNGNGSLQPQLRLQGTLPDTRPRLTPNIAPTATIARGIWQRWEVIVDCNAVNTANGRARWWIDGVLVSDYQDINWAAAGKSCTWEQIQLRPVWGGTGGTVTNAMYLRMDHIHVSGTP